MIDDFMDVYMTFSKYRFSAYDVINNSHALTDTWLSRHQKG